MKLDQQQLNIMLEWHNLYLNNKEGGRKLTLFNQDLKGLDFKEQNLSYAEFAGSDLSYANLEYCKMNYANLNGTYFVKTRLKGADMAFVEAENALFAEADLRSVNLSHANLTDANLSFTKLNDADLHFAKMWNTRMENNTLQGARAESIYGQTVISCNISLDATESYAISYWLNQDIWVSPIGEGDLRPIRKKLDEEKDRLNEIEEGKGDIFKIYYERCIDFVHKQAFELMK